MLTLDAEKHLEKTLDVMYREVPIRKLFVMDGGSGDGTLEILKKYPRMEVKIEKDTTHGKGFEILKDMVQTSWFVFIDVAKIPADGWYDEMTKHKDEYDFMGSNRIFHYEFERESLIIKDPNKRFLGGPWFIKTKMLERYKVDNDYVWRVLDIVLKKALEEIGGRYGLVDSTYHTCYISEGERYQSDSNKRGIGLVFKEPEVIVYNKQRMQERLDMTAKAIVKYLFPKEAEYFLNDHWWLMIDNLPVSWIQETNEAWIAPLYEWRHKRLVIAKTKRFLYNSYKTIIKRMEEKIETKIKKDFG
jgi:glycosyltransferase involved in cell wall biosynthesis